MEFTAVCILGIIILILSAMLLSLRKEILSIVAAFKEKLSSDTNTLIDVECKDRAAVDLANTLNASLKELRGLRHTYESRENELTRTIENLSHDMRTPLTAICGYLDMLEECELHTDAQRYVSIIKSRADALCELTEELLYFSVSYGGDKKVQIEPVSLNSILEECILSFYTEFKSAGITPQISIPDKPVIVFANSAALSRAFSNIIKNAVTHGVGNLSVSLMESGEITFSNNAPELSNIDVGRIFDRYFTVNSAQKSTGLGLAIAKKLILQYGGEIKAEYESGRLIVIVKLKKATD